MVKRGDICTVILVLLLIAVLFVSSFSPLSSSVLKADIYLDGEIERTVLLDGSQDGVLTVGECEIEISGGEIRFLSSSCKDGLCVKHGALKNSGDTMACVPNRVVITVRGEKQQNDAVAY